VEVGEDADRPLALLLQGRELAHRIAALAVDDERHRSPLRGLRRIAGERQKLLETLHVGVAIGGRHVDDLAIVQRALLDGLADGVHELRAGDRSMGDGDDQAILMGNANVYGHASCGDY
jgi:hypothetical protein